MEGDPLGRNIDYIREDGFNALTAEVAEEGAGAQENDCHAHEVAIDLCCESRDDGTGLCPHKRPGEVDSVIPLENDD